MDRTTISELNSFYHTRIEHHFMKDSSNPRNNPKCLTDLIFSPQAGIFRLGDRDPSLPGLGDVAFGSEVSDCGLEAKVTEGPLLDRFGDVVGPRLEGVGGAGLTAAAARFRRSIWKEKRTILRQRKSL
jgi:hypothetical protein